MRKNETIHIHIIIRVTTKGIILTRVFLRMKGTLLVIMQCKRYKPGLSRENQKRVVILAKLWPQRKYRLLKKETQLDWPTDFSTATTDIRRQWEKIFRLLRENKSQPGPLYPARCYRKKNLLWLRLRLREFTIMCPCWKKN